MTKTKNPRKKKTSAKRQTTLSARLTRASAKAEKLGSMIEEGSNLSPSQIQKLLVPFTV